MRIALKGIVFCASLVASLVVGLWVEDRRPGTFDQLMGTKADVLVEPENHIIIGAGNIIIDPSAYQPKAAPTPIATGTPAPRLTSPEVLQPLEGIASFSQNGSQRVETTQSGFLNGDIKTLTLAWHTSTAHDVDVRLRDGVAYTVAESSCPSVLSDAGECEIKIKMTAPGSGAFKDTLDIISGQNRIATAHLSGLDERPMAPDFVFTPQTRRTFIKRDSAINGAEVSMQLWLINVGDAPAQIHTVQPVVFDDYGRDWKQTGGSCITRVVPSGSACSVDYTIKVKHSVPFTSRFTVSRNHRHKRSDDKTASVTVHVAGIHADIPGTLMAGDPCPEKGQTAEVVVLADTSRLSGRSALPVINTATCVWKAPAEDGRQLCDKDKTIGVQHHVATLKRYRHQNGVWDRSEVRQGYVTPFLSCSQGIIKEVRHTW